MKLTKELDHPREGLINVETFTKLKKRILLALPCLIMKKSKISSLCINKML